MTFNTNAAQRSSVGVLYTTLTPQTINTMSTNPRKKKTIIIEDLRETAEELKGRNYDVERITHNELMASTGEVYNTGLLRGDYHLLWIATPGDWYVLTPDRRCNTHWQRVTDTESH